MDVYASAERQHGWSAGTADEDDAVHDVPHAADVLLHIQRLFIRS